MKPLILASASPRRKALLEGLGLRIDVRPSGAEEIMEGAPRDVVAANARAKCGGVAAEAAPGGVAIGADTIVVLDGDILGKPAGLEEAREMLRRLSGRTHVVITGVAVRETGKAGRAQWDTEETEVTFRELNEEEIERFIGIVKPLDRAGAYTVDGPGSLLVRSYHGCYYNVLGLPLVCLDMLLRELGVQLFHALDTRRAVFL